MPFQYFQVPNLLKPGDQGQNRDQEVVPGVLKKVVPVQARAQEGLEVEVLQVNRVDQVGPRVRPRIPIEITLTVDRGLFYAKEESSYDVHQSKHSRQKKNAYPFFIDNSFASISLIN